MDSRQKMSQEQIDALLKDSMFADSELSQSKQPPKRQIQHSNTYAQEEFQSYQESYAPKSNYEKKQPQNTVEESYGYANQQFQSYEESKSIPNQNVQKPNSKSKTIQPTKKKLEDIKQQVSPKRGLERKKDSSSKDKVKPKTAIYFYPPKQQQHAGNSCPDKVNLPYNYARMQERQRQLLFTTLTEENKRLKEELSMKDLSYQKLEKAYKVVLQQKAHQASSVRQVTLEKQLAALQSRYEKLQNLTKLQKQKNNFKSTKLSQSFVPSEKVNQREEQLLEIIDTLKERLVSTDTELKILQKKMSEGENYIDELKRKMKRVEQLEYKMQKMTNEAENDREYIKHLKDKNTQIEKQLFEVHKEKRLMEVQIRRYELGQATQSDTMEELKQVRMEKEKLQKNLREVVMNMTSLSRAKDKEWTVIEESGQLLRS